MFELKTVQQEGIRHFGIVQVNFSPLFTVFNIKTNEERMKSIRKMYKILSLLIHPDSIGIKDKLITEWYGIRIVE